MKLLPRGLALLLALSLSAGAVGQDVEVEVELNQFGPGTAYRPGDYTGIQLLVTSNLTEPVAAWVQVEIPNADGDITEYGRNTSLTPGRAQPLWIYAPLPPSLDPSTVLSVRVYEMEDDRRRRELGGTRITPPGGGAVGIDAAMIGIVGQKRANLDQLASIGPARQVPVSAHEITRVIFGLDPDESGQRPAGLPDRWEGWRPYEAVVWTDAAPSDLREATAKALVEYVRRGGHLVIVLEGQGDKWGLDDQGVNDQGLDVEYDLDVLLPTVPPTRDYVPLSKLLSVLGKSRSTVQDFDVAVKVFDDLPSGSPWEPLIKLDDGRTIVIQRLFGFGRITIVGMDVALDQLNKMMLGNGSLGGLPQADVFWGRIFGRRADAPTTGEIRDIEEKKLLNTGASTENDLGAGRLIAETISMQRQAGIGLFLAFVLFSAYWFVAGPGGFYILKHFRQVHHSWLAFAAAAGLFTALAWGIVSLIPTAEVGVQHLTYLDYVARGPHDPRNNLVTDDGTNPDPQLARATGWFSVFLDDYRDTEVGIVSDADQRDLLGSWSPPGMNVQRFPNVDRYAVDVDKSPSRYEMPGRSTVTQMYASWLGGYDMEAFGRLIQVANPISVEIDASGIEQGLRGTLVNELPGELTQVKIIWVKGNRVTPRRYARSGDDEMSWTALARSGQLMNTGRFWALGAWGPGEEIELDDLTMTASGRLAENIESQYIEPYIQAEFGLPSASTSLNQQDRNRYLEMLSIFHQLTPPIYLKSREAEPDRATVRLFRQLGRELDLSAWFTRPCIIILGQFRNSPCPVPLEVAGDAPVSDGTTIVRWIYPLPLDERVVFPQRMEPVQ